MRVKYAQAILCIYEHNELIDVLYKLHTGTPQDIKLDLSVCSKTARYDNGKTFIAALKQMFNYRRISEEQMGSLFDEVDYVYDVVISKYCKQIDLYVINETDLSVYS